MGACVCIGVWVRVGIWVRVRGVSGCMHGCAGLFAWMYECMCADICACFKRVGVSACGFVGVSGWVYECGWVYRCVRARVGLRLGLSKG